MLQAKKTYNYLLTFDNTSTKHVGRSTDLEQF